MKKLIYVLSAAACFVCAELKADDKPQGVVTKIERTYDKEGKLRLITFSYKKDGKYVPYLEWSGGWPFDIDYEEGKPHLRKIGDGMGGYRFPYLFRPPNGWEKSFVRIRVSDYKWNDKCFIGFQLVQNAKENH